MVSESEIGRERGRTRPVPQEGPDQSANPPYTPSSTAADPTGNPGGYRIAYHATSATRAANMGRGKEGNGPCVDRLAVCRLEFGHCGDFGGVRYGGFEDTACQREEREPCETPGRDRETYREQGPSFRAATSHSRPLITPT